MTPPGPRPRTPAQVHLMTALMQARQITTEHFHFATNGEHPVIRLARLIGDPTRKERADLIALLSRTATVEDIADAVFDFFAMRAMGEAA